MNSIETKTVRTETIRRIELSEDDLIKLVELASGEKLPARAEVYVEIPGGGDWSNTSLDIADSPVIITWTEVITE